MQIGESTPTGLAYRVIARLDIKGDNLIKGIQFEGLRVLGKPQEFAKKYAEDADELIYIDTVSSLYGRNQLEKLIEETCSEVFIPITVGGGIKSVEDARRLFDHGADKVAVNSEAIRRPELISELASHYGSQAVTVSIQAKRTNEGWEAYTDCGRNRSGKNVIEWAKEAQERGAGEILITSIDNDGLRHGCDFGLLRELSACSVPIIYSGGIRLQDVVEVSKYTDGMVIGASLHYGNCTIAQVKDMLRQHKEIR